MEFTKNRFKDRMEAAKLLSEKLSHYKNENPIVLAIPRGAVPMAAEVAKALHASFDIVLIKKIGSLHNPELAIGAISEDGHSHFNDELVKILGLNSSTLSNLAKDKEAELKQQIKLFRGSKKPLEISGRIVIIVDDGIATGATLISAIEFLSKKNPKKIVVASPVGAKDTIRKLEKFVDDVVVLLAPVDFIAVGLWYETFGQVSDQEVLAVLKDAREKRPPPEDLSP